MSKPNSRLPENLDRLFTGKSGETPETGKTLEPQEKIETPKTVAEIKNSKTPKSLETAKTLEKFTIPVSPETAKRIYSEVYHDPERRWLRIVVAELLEEALARRPKKKDAPDGWVAQHKIKGKAKKS